MLPVGTFLVLFLAAPVLSRYEPNWQSLDTRPLPQWYDEAKVGIFVHWGVFSVPSFKNEWFWYSWQGNPPHKDYVEYMENNYKPGFTYQEFAKEFTAELWDPDDWARMFKNSGAKYVVLTAKHHEGYTMWPSKYSYSWNAKDVGPNRDLVGDLANAVRSANLTFGLYHSLMEWFNPLFLADKANNYSTMEFARQKTMPELYELVNTYKPWVIWSDGSVGAPWHGPDFVSWLYNDSPVKDVCVVNDRWGDASCKHGDFYTCGDRYSPGQLVNHKWENAMTIDKKSWGFRRDAKLEEFYTNAELIGEIAKTISCGGNILINIAPTKDGTIPVIFQERLYNMGQWLGINGEAIYASQPWTYQNDTLTPGVWYTKNHNAVYAIVLNWPKGNSLDLASAVELFHSSDTTVTLLGNENDGYLKTTVAAENVTIHFPDKATVKSDLAWVLKIK